MQQKDVANERFIMLLGRSRNDPEVVRLIDAFSDEAVRTVDREDVADEEYIEVKNYGFSLYFDTGKLASVFLYSDTKDPEYSTYALGLPLAVSFRQSKLDVVSHLGTPSAEGGGKIGVFGRVPRWVRYDRGTYSVHIEFADEPDLVQMVTLMPH